jgi:hypothetical protein
MTLVNQLRELVYSPESEKLALNAVGELWKGEIVNVLVKSAYEKQTSCSYFVLNQRPDLYSTEQLLFYIVQHAKTNELSTVVSGDNVMFSWVV